MFQDRFRDGEGTELVISMHKARAKLTAKEFAMSWSHGGEPGRALFCAKVTWVNNEHLPQPINGLVE